MSTTTSLPQIAAGKSRLEPGAAGRRVLELAAACLIAALWLGAIFWVAATEGVPGDFSAFYCGAQILHTRGPSALYDFDAMRDCHARYFPGNQTVLPFIRPPFYAVLLLPFIHVTPSAALLAWLSINVAALVGAVRLTAKAAGMDVAAVAWHAAIFFPALAVFFNRQDVPLVFLAAAAAAFLLARGHHFAAGLVLALCCIKFHLLLLVPLGLLFNRNRRALQGLVAGAVVLAVVSVLMVGPGGAAAYASLLFERNVPGIETHPGRIVNVSNLAGGTWVRFPLMVLAVAAVAMTARRLSAVEALAAAWMGSLLVAPHVFISDYLLVLPACLLLARLSRVCLWSGVLLLFPFIPLLMALNERLVLLAPLLSLVCLMGAMVACLPRRISQA